MLTDNERDELEKLQLLWATQQASKAQILRCMELERKGKVAA